MGSTRSALRLTAQVREHGEFAASDAVPFEFAPLSRLQRARPARALQFAQALQSALVKSTDPALHRRRIFAEQKTDLPTRLTGCDQEQSVQR